MPYTTPPMHVDLPDLGGGCSRDFILSRKVLRGVLFDSKPLILRQNYISIILHDFQGTFLESFFMKIVAFFGKTTWVRKLSDIRRRECQSIAEDTHTRNRATAQPPRASVSPPIAMSNSRKSPYLPNLSELRERDAVKEIKQKIEQLMESDEPFDKWYQSIIRFCHEASKGGNAEALRACYKEDGEVWEFACTRMGVERPAALTWRSTFHTLCAQLSSLHELGGLKPGFFTDKSKNQWLIQAVQQQSALALQHLLARGGDPNAFGKVLLGSWRTRVSLLGTAAQGDSAYIVKLLLDAGATVDLLAYGEAAIRRTPLGFASNHGNVPIAQLLLDNDADVNFRDEMGGTPLHYAAGKGNLAMVKLLVKYGADVTARTDSMIGGLCPWEYAARNLDASDNSETREKLRQMVIEAAGGPRQPPF